MGEPTNEPLRVIRLGLLHVPALDLETGAAVVRLAAAAMRRPTVVLREGYAAADRRWIETTLVEWCDEVDIDLLLTLGGTLPAPGPSAREAVPEATLAAVERLVPGIPEAMRGALRHDYPEVILDRGVAGIRGRTLIVNLPSGVGPATAFLETVAPELPLIVDHLREAATARPLHYWMVVEEVADEAPAPPAPTKSGKGLNAADFAAFLQRKQQQGGE